ncbi:MAG TPA: hypothetical protein VIK01_26685 [Polyangiaceae bacterium]
MISGTGQVRRFNITAGTAAKVVGPHSFEQMAACARNQRAGRPAAVCTEHAAKLRRAAEREQRKTVAHEAQKLARAQARIRARENRNEGDDHDDPR